MRVPISFALTYPSARRRLCRGSTSPGTTLEFERARPRDVSRCSGLAREAGERGGTSRAPSTRRTRSPWRRSSTVGSASSRSRRSSRTRSARSTVRLPDLEQLIEADTRGDASRGKIGNGMSSSSRSSVSRSSSSSTRPGTSSPRWPSGSSSPVLRRLPACDREDDPQGDRVRDRRDTARRLRDDSRHAPTDPTRCRAPVLARRGGRAGPRRLGGSRGTGNWKATT